MNPTANMLRNPIRPDDATSRPVPSGKLENGANAPSSCGVLSFMWREYAQQRRCSAVLASVEHTYTSCGQETCVNIIISKPSRFPEVQPGRVLGNYRFPLQ
uniref:Uncharacterized protein n=1 Tax=Sphaerodactylus townsendi TaxID=933632 RepID=A0ACB8EQ77_9SAUR